MMIIKENKKMLINFLKWQIFHYSSFTIRGMDVKLFSFIIISWDFNKKINEKKWHFGGWNFHKIIPNQNMIRGKRYSIIEIESR